MTSNPQNQKPKGSPKARATAARLAAVQAVYQIITNDQPASSVISEYRLHRFNQPVDEVEMVTPDGTLFQDIVSGTYDRWNELESILSAALEKSGKSLPSEPLLRGIMLCGAWELLSNHDADGPLIVAEYLDVTHAFYDQGESRLVNAVLDSVLKSVR